MSAAYSPQYICTVFMCVLAELIVWMHARLIAVASLYWLGCVHSCVHARHRNTFLSFASPLAFVCASSWLCIHKVRTVYMANAFMGCVGGWYASPQRGRPSDDLCDKIPRIFGSVRKSLYCLPNLNCGKPKWGRSVVSAVAK